MTRAAAAAAVLALAACRHVHHAPAGGPPAKPEAPDSGSAKGVPPAPGRPREPAGPEALLAEGAVGKIERALASRGLLHGHQEGELDPPTSAAIRKFQGENGLAATGFPDRETLKKLGIDPEDAYGREGDRKKQAQGERPREDR